MSRETYFCVEIVEITENNGWSFIVGGAERATRKLSLEEAVDTYGTDRIIKVLDETREMLLQKNITNRGG